MITFLNASILFFGTPNFRIWTEAQNSKLDSKEYASILRIWKNKGQMFTRSFPATNFPILFNIEILARQPYRDCFLAFFRCFFRGLVVKKVVTQKQFGLAYVIGAYVCARLNRVFSEDRSYANEFEWAEKKVEPSEQIYGFVSRNKIFVP